MIVHMVTSLCLRHILGACLEAEIEGTMTDEARGHLHDLFEWMSLPEQEWFPTDLPDLWTWVDAALTLIFEPVPD